jgi:hypothetical protein
MARSSWTPTVLVVDEAGMLGSRKLAACSSTPDEGKRRWCWSATTGSWRRSMPAAASAPSASASAPAS